MVDKVTQPSWWLKDENQRNHSGNIILGGILGMLIGIIIVFSFSRFLLENFGGWWGIYGIAFGFVILGGLFGLFAEEEKSDKTYKKKDVNYWRSR
jgi:hypothetical protein